MVSSHPGEGPQELVAPCNPTKIKMSKTKYQVSTADLKRITASLKASLPDKTTVISFQYIYDEFKERGYALNYPAQQMVSLFNYWRREGETRLLHMSACELAYELEEKRNSQRKMKECFRSLLDLD